jgi:predicted O-methyltransferase YrrM
MNFLPENIEQYAEAHTHTGPSYLSELERETYSKILQPRMLSGHLQGRFLAFISKIHKPKRILEIGTYTGYSALCLAEGLADGGKLTTIDINRELHWIIEKYVNMAGFSDRIEIITANALDYLNDLTDSLDLVFIDADKENYCHYFEQVLPLVRSGGIIMADNVLWSGKVTGTLQKDDAETHALIEYSKLVCNNKAVESMLLPIRDGIMISRKL